MSPTRDNYVSPVKMVHEGDGFLRILTWNLWGRYGPWEQRERAIAAVLAEQNADVLCLQESWVDLEGVMQAERLATLLGDVHHVVADRPSGMTGVTATNAVLSRWPVVKAETCWLPRVGGGVPYRSALFVTLDAPVGPLVVASTHLDHQFDASASRQAQAAALARYTAERRGDPDTAFPVIVAGDLNAVPDSDEIRGLCGRREPPVPGLIFTDAWDVAGDGGPGITWTAGTYQPHTAWPRRRLDYVLVSWPRPKPLGNPVRCAVIGNEAVGDPPVLPSDHFGVVADLCSTAGET
jgi:endonuclease/exonuclease/phosphatase family metal-dependent hydrolase